MKTLLTTLLLLTLVACGGKDEDKKSTNNGVASEQRYTALANAYNENELLYDNLGVFSLDLIKDRNFRLLAKSRMRSGYQVILSSTWTVAGVSIVLDQVGNGTYLESTINGVKYDCIMMNSASLTEFMRDEISKAGITAPNPYLQFCKRN